MRLASSAQAGSQKILRSEFRALQRLPPGCPLARSMFERASTDRPIRPAKSSWVSRHKTGISADKAGDFRRFPPQVSASWESRDESECAKSRDFRPIRAFLAEPGRTPDCHGWRRSTDRTCLRANSLLTGNFTGKSAIPRAWDRISSQRNRCVAATSQTIP